MEDNTDNKLLTPRMSFSSMLPNVSAMSSGGFGTTHYQNTENDN
jgi:hypothetical protein